MKTGEIKVLSTACSVAVLLSSKRYASTILTPSLTEIAVLEVIGWKIRIRISEQ